MMEMFTLLLVVLTAMTSLGTGLNFSVRSRTDQEEYLQRFAYMGPDSPDSRLGELKNPDEIFRMAVEKFQRMAGLEETGEVDEETMKMMEMPRCGNKDEIGMGSVTRRRKRYAVQGSRWMKTQLTYRINNFTPDLTQQVTESEIRTAFQHWSSASPLKFTEIKDKDRRVDIDINFVRGDHGDGSKFDGMGGTLAHAFFPRYGGDAHFDEDERWSSQGNQGTNLLQVAIHEFGHSLGLSHSSVKESIMAPFYRGYVPNVKLHSDDIAGIRYLYGSMDRQVSSTERTPPPSGTTSRPSDHPICRDPKVDAIFAVSGDIYVFKGSQYYVLNSSGIIQGYPRSINSDWSGLPNDLDTAFYWPSPPDGFPGGVFNFFKGDKVWSYNSNREPNGSNPRAISERFPRLPNGSIDAAFIWSGNGRLYFVKDDKYFGYNSLRQRIALSYPRALRIWKGLPAKIDAAFNYTNGRTYFFSGHNYYRFNDMKFTVDSGYPKSTAGVWLGCSSGSGSYKMSFEMEEGDDQFVMAGVSLPTTSSFIITAAMLAALLSSYLIQ